MSTLNDVREAIRNEFDKYDEDQVSEYVKRFLRESLVQLYEASLEDAKRKHDKDNHNKKYPLNRNTSQTYLLKMRNMHSLEKQISLLTEWLQWFIEPSSLPMTTMAIIKIVECLETHAKRSRNLKTESELGLVMTPATPANNQKKNVKFENQNSKD